MPYRVLYPYGLLTDDYGILDQEADLAVDTWRGIPHPYNERGFNGGYPYWTCFPMNQTSVHYKTWRGNDGMGPADAIITMCELEFTAETDTEINRYFERRAYPVERCRDLVKEWKQVTLKQPHVCFNAYDGEIEPHKTLVEVKAEKIWTWDRIKTNAGCMSYFGGHCDLKYWKKERETGYLSK